jgi:tRNA A58 N-methylase Trm61
MAISMDVSQESCTITGGEQDKQRLNLLAAIFQPTTLRPLQDVGLRRGDRCLNLGCGSGHVVLDMARMVGPDGFVTGMDFDPQIVELACQDAEDAGVGNVDYHVGDVRVFDRGPCHGLAIDQEIDSILTRVYSFVQEPATPVALPHIVQVRRTA